MQEERKSKTASKKEAYSPGCLLVLGAMFGVILGCGLSAGLAHWEYGFSLIGKDEIRSVMETYYFGYGLANLTGDTSILEDVVTERALQSMKDHCNSGLCDGIPPPHVIGEYFNVVKQTDEFAVVELSDRPIIHDTYSRGTLRRCYSLVRDGDDWRVSGGYLDCDGYLPDKYK